MTREPIRFRANREKITETVVWLAGKAPGLTLDKVARILFLADKSHLNRFGRLVTGDAYLAADNGPFPREAMAVISAGPAGVILSGDGSRLAQAVRDPDLDLFSKTDLDALGEALAAVSAMTGRDILSEARQEPCWAGARKNGGDRPVIGPETMVDDGPHREGIIAYMREMAGSMVL